MKQIPLLAISKCDICSYFADKEVGVMSEQASPVTTSAKDTVLVVLVCLDIRCEVFAMTYSVALAFVDALESMIDTLRSHLTPPLKVSIKPKNQQTETKPNNNHQQQKDARFRSIADLREVTTAFHSLAKRCLQGIDKFGTKIAIHNNVIKQETVIDKNHQEGARRFQLWLNQTENCSWQECISSVLSFVKSDRIGNCYLDQLSVSVTLMMMMMMMMAVEVLTETSI